jgi:hypothetical protein
MVFTINLLREKLKDADLATINDYLSKLSKKEEEVVRLLNLNVHSFYVRTSEAIVIIPKDEYEEIIKIAFRCKLSLIRKAIELVNQKLEDFEWII